MAEPSSLLPRQEYMLPNQFFELHFINLFVCLDVKSLEYLTLNTVLLKIPFLCSLG